MVRIRNRRNRRFSGAFLDEEDVNPMDYVSNLSDAMLVLAVGMMLALVVAWNVDLVGIGNSITEAGVEGEADLEQKFVGISGMDATDPASYGLTEYGTVYTDGNGNLYVIEEIGE